MAKKLKFSPHKKNQPGLFDLTGNLFDQPSATPPSPDTPSPDADSAQKLEEDVRKRMADFVVNVARQRAEAQAEAEAEEKRRREIEIQGATERDQLLFISFGSGSSGNCSYIGDRHQGVLIDAGVDGDKVAAGLKANGLSMSCVRGICLTHDHGDHVRYVYSIVRKLPDVGIYCTPKTLNGMLRRHNISRRIKDYHRPIYKEFPFKLAGMELTAFEVSHDGTDNSGFYIERGDHRMTVATDLGSITDRVDYYMRRARYIVIEANYDAQMLSDGPYPIFLKARIAAANGHLDNRVTAAFLREIYTPQLRNVFLCHLSQENNTPEAARSVIEASLLETGLESVGDGSGSISARQSPLQLYVLPRLTPSPLFALY